MQGGKVLGSGTYGCIFKPPLPCVGETVRYSALRLINHCMTSHIITTSRTSICNYL